MHDEAARREWERSDRYLSTSTQLFEVANRIAPCDERSDLGSPGAGGIDEEPVSAEPNLVMPPVPGALAQKRGACSLGSRHRLGRRIGAGHDAVRIQKPEPWTVAGCAGSTGGAMSDRLADCRTAMSVRIVEDQLAESTASARLENFSRAVGRSVVDDHCRAEFGAQESVERPQQHGDKAPGIVVRGYDHNTRRLGCGVRVWPPRRSLDRRTHGNSSAGAPVNGFVAQGPPPRYLAKEPLRVTRRGFFR